MDIDYFSLSQVHLLGESATHPIEPLATRLGSLLLLAGKWLAKSSPLQGAARPEAWPLRAASSPLGRVQLRNLGSCKRGVLVSVSVSVSVLFWQW